MRRLILHPLSLIAYTILLLAIAEASLFHFLRPAENRVSDFFVRMQAQHLNTDPEIVIIDIDEYSLQRMSSNAGSWPWPRSIQAEIIEGIEKQHPQAIVYDIFFTEPDIFRAESDAALNQTLSHYRNIYLPIARKDRREDSQGAQLSRIAEFAPASGITPSEKADNQARVSLLLPMAIKPDTWRLGTVNFIEDEDGVGRRYDVAIPAYGWAIPSLPARIISDMGLPLPETSQIILNWRGGASAFRHISFADIYDDINLQHSVRAPDEFNNKIVIIGTSATGLFDLRATPISSQHPGVEILATAIDNMKNQRSMQRIPDALPSVMTFVLIIALLAAFQRSHHLVKIGLALISISFALLAISYLSLTAHLLMPVAASLSFAWLFYFSAAIYGHMKERREREYAVQVFGRFLDPRIVKSLVTQGEIAHATSGQSRDITVLFSDIRGFTSLSESRPPQEVVDILNRYFSMQVEVIFRHGGTLDKFIGDAIMAFWGAPADDKDHACHAIAAALEMSRQLEKFQAESGPLLEHFDIGIGIHSGPAVVGFIGSERRQEYTAIGDTVNLASRIEGETKGKCRILVSQDTVAQCHDKFDFIDHGTYKVKGRMQEVRLYEPRSK